MFFRQAAFKAARKIASVQHDDTESSDAESSSGSSCPSDSTLDSDSGMLSETCPRILPPPILPSQRLTICHQTAPILLSSATSPEELSPSLMDALAKLSLSSLRMQHSRPRALPFLLRNLRRGFKKLCAELG